MESKGWEDALTNPADPNSTKVKGALKQCVEQVFLRSIQTAPDAATAWQRLQQLFNQTSEANYLTLRRQFNNLKLLPKEGVLELVVRAQDLADQLAAAQDPVDDRALAAQILDALPPRFNIVKHILKRAPALPTIDTLRATLLQEEEEQKQEAASNATAAADAASTAISSLALNRDQAFASNESHRGSGWMSNTLSRPRNFGNYGNSSSSFRPNFQQSRGTPNYNIGRFSYRDNFGSNSSANRRYPSAEPRHERYSSDSRHDRYNSDTRHNRYRPEEPERPSRCNYCAGRGHTERDCPAKQREEDRQSRMRKPAPTRQADEIAFTATCMFSPAGGYSCDPDTWFVDSAASKHMSGFGSIFSDLEELPEPHTVTYGNGTTLTAVAKGTVVVRAKGDVHCPLSLKNVLYIPGHHANLLSVNAVTEAGGDVVMEPSGCTIVMHGKPVITAGREGNLWAVRDCSYKASFSTRSEATQAVLDKYSNNRSDPDSAQDPDPAQETAMAARQQQLRTPEEWHSAYGHLGYQNLAKLPGIVTGIDVPPSAFLAAGKEVCNTCQQNKQVSMPFEPATSKTTQPLELVHSDLCGPIYPPTKGGARYIATFLDDYTKFSVVRLLKHKSDMNLTLPAVLLFLERQVAGSHKVKAMRTDNGTEYVNAHITQWFTSNGIVHQTSNPYTPQQNGKAERLNKTLLEKMRSMINGADLPAEMWGEAAIAANMLRNRSPATGIKVTPYEMFTATRPNVSFLRPYGATGFALIPKQKRTTKLDEVSVEGKLVGYELGGSGYRLLLSDGTICSSRNVIFRKISHEAGSSASATAGATTIATKRVTFQLEGDSDKATADPDDSDDDSLPDLMPDPDYEESDDDVPALDPWSDSEDSSEEEDAPPPPPPAAPLPAVPPPAAPAPGPSAAAAAAAAGGQTPAATMAAPTAASRRSIRSNLGVPPSRMGDFAMAATVSRDTFSTANIPEPQSYKEAMQSEHRAEWLHAMNDEMASLIEQGTWEYVPVPPGVNPIPVKWVFKVKRDGLGNLDRLKARLVAKGFKQQEGIDYDEVFAPVTKYSTFRTVMALTAAGDMEIEQLDIKTAFLQGELAERVYIQQPEGFEEGGKDMCYLLNKAIYGLKQAPRVWYERLHKELVALGFKVAEADPGLYVYQDSANCLYLLVYVDDILLISKDKSFIAKIKRQLLDAFDARDLGEATTYLGINILRDRGSGTLSVVQQRMMDDIIAKFDLGNTKPVTTPMSCSIKLSKEEGAPLDKVRFPYSQLVGSLMYLSICTRPDISHSVGEH
eukprot:GHUV01002897.1.p1 GENE.GHUV01002897.1~~GHUV01002897.1.p1  ORF type:complete len:1307 (+),score=342.07 GHUV01002897.1:73-3921(+)